MMQEERPGEEFHDEYSVSETPPSVSEPYASDSMTPTDEYGMSETVPYIPYETSYAQTPESDAASTGGEQSAVISPLEEGATTPIAPDAFTSASQPRKSRRRRWIVAGIIALLVVVLASVASFFLINYINRPTPNRTLDAFCSALQHEDYRTAYSEFSPGMQSTIPEADFAALLSQDKVTLCTHGNTDDSKNSVTTSLKLVHASKGINADVVTLTKDKDNNWKISDIGRQQ